MGESNVGVPCPFAVTVQVTLAGVVPAHHARPSHLRAEGFQHPEAGWARDLGRPLRFLAGPGQHQGVGGPLGGAPVFSDASRTSPWGNCSMARRRRPRASSKSWVIRPAAIIAQGLPGRMAPEQASGRVCRHVNGGGPVHTPAGRRSTGCPDGSPTGGAHVVLSEVAARPGKGDGHRQKWLTLTPACNSENLRLRQLSAGRRQCLLAPGTFT